MSPALSLYLALTSLASPAAGLALRRRLAAGKEDPERLGERLGQASVRRPEGMLAWFHGASVGEGLSMLPLIDRLRAARPDVSILVTSGTVTSAHLLAERLPTGTIHQYVPLDIEPAVSKFLTHWRPDLAIWIESEIWPRLVLSVAAREVPALLLNARLSERSRARWSRLHRAARRLFTVFAHVQAQDEQTAAALLRFGVQPSRVRVTGSFKEAAGPLPFDAEELHRLRQDTAGRFVWLAASTHPGEEQLTLEAHRTIAARDPSALLIIVPRHPNRGNNVAALVEASGLTWSRRCDGAPGAASVYLADTLGELGLWYRIARIAFVGGSTIGVGGHNPYEPAALGVAIIHGPDTANFATVYHELDAGRAACSVRTAEELAEAVLGLSQGSEASAMADRASRVIGIGSVALEHAIGAILSSLPPSTA